MFDLYLPNSIKEHERNRRKTTQGILTNIPRFDQPLPVDMDTFWSLNDNKVNFQQFFIKWVKETYSNIESSVYLDGSHVDDVTSCVLISNGHITLERLLKCDHEEADDRILFHVNHGVKVEKFRSVIIASPDTDIFICSFIENIDISPVEYGYIENSEEQIIPIVVSDVLIPPDFPSPCNCMKCSKSNVCNVAKFTKFILFAQVYTLYNEL